MNYTRAGGENHDRKDQYQHHRSAEVRFDHDERRKQPRHQTAGNKRAPEVAFFTRALLEEVGKKDDEREFRHFARLKRGARKLYPAMRAINAAETKHRNEADRADNQQGVNDATVLQLLIVELHREQHHDESYCNPRALLEHVVKLVVVLFLGDYGGRAIDHHDAEQREADGRREEPFIWR